MQGVTTQVSKMNSNTTCTTDLKKNLETRGSIPSLLSIIFILFHTSLAREKFLTTAGKSLYAAKITCPSYQNEFTISKGRP